MKHRYFHFLRSSLVLFLCVLLILATNIFTPTAARAFGSLSENGTAAFMGIGINPTKILHVSGSGTGSVPLFQRGSDSAGFIIERTPTNRWVLGVNESPTLGNGFVLSTIPTGNTSVARLMITPAGNVGIGTLYPYHKLEVYTNGGNAAVTGRYETEGGTNYGDLGSSGAGVWGSGVENNDGVVGRCADGNGDGVRGESMSGNGVYGFSTSGYSVFGKVTSNGAEAVVGTCLSSDGRLGSSQYKAGVYGTSAAGYAGYFEGRVRITDNLSVSDNLTVGTANHEPLTQMTVVNSTAANGSKAIYGKVTHTGDAQAVYGLHDDSGNYGFLGDNTWAVYGYNRDHGTRGGLGGVNYAGYFVGNVKVDGSLATAYTAVDNVTTYDVLSGDSIVAVSATAGTCSVYLPAASGIAGRTCTIKKVDSSPNKVRVYGNGGTELIDGSAAYIELGNYKYVIVVSNGSGWYIVGGNY